MSKLYWIAHCGEHAIERTSCMVEVEHFTDPLAYGRRLNRIIKLHRAETDEVESYTYGEVEEPAKPFSPGLAMVPHTQLETAMALWEAVLDARHDDGPPITPAFEVNGFAEMRRMASELIPACEAAWEIIKDDYEDAWDWEFLPIVVSLWIEADFDHKAVTVEKIVAAATGKEG